MKCKIEGCTKDVRYAAQGVCQMHYFRFMRNGHYGVKGARTPGAPRPRKERYSDNRGYVMVFANGHPLADKRGLVREHRLVYHDQVDANPTECKLCQAPINWKTLHIDHEDNNPSNNAAANLRALCRACNVYRAHTRESMGKHFFEVDGVRMTAQAWARQPGVEVAGHTILHRRRRGYSDFEAVYGKRKTHQGTQTKKPHKKYDALRQIQDQEQRLSGRSVPRSEEEVA